MLSAFSGLIKTSANLPAAGAQITVTRSDGSPATLYANESGSSTLQNPLSTANDGRLAFFAPGGNYVLTGTLNNDELAPVAITLPKNGSRAFRTINAAANVAIDIQRDEVVDITLTQATTTLLLEGDLPLNHSAATLELTLRQGSGANAVVWPNGILWPSGQPPVLAYEAGYSDVVTIVAQGNGRYLGFHNGGWL
ncbi:hypothetical protein [Spongiibacter sp. UBA1325]|uniref:hypothetical protein n=1 Tax=Spongiibacter sp. UBA1325 TaxID=1947543 RepID=UPI00257BD217|nr:hypothetical protein [Spongiibacter sp. UBA1325]|tara:strand:- start:3479 stop:4063 length:585 start_codon:yes stop_codon:yes gene_type:complete